MYLLDSNIIIGLLNGDISLQQRLSEFPSGSFHISAITYMEIVVGILTPASLLQALQFLDLFHCFSFTKETALVMKQHFPKPIKKTNHKDVMIASTALEYGYTVVTLDKNFPVCRELSVIYL